MAVVDKPSARETKRLQTRERLMGAAIAEFKRAGMAEADVGAIVAAAGVAHGTFFFHFPTKEHVLFELEQREEGRIAKQLGRAIGSEHDLAPTLSEAVRLSRSKTIQGNHETHEKHERKAAGIRCRVSPRRARRWRRLVDQYLRVTAQVLLETALQP